VVGPLRFSNNHRKSCMLKRCPNGVPPAVVVLMAAYGVVACSTAPPRTTAERGADADITDRVQAALLADPNIYARHIDVAVDRGVVVLVHLRTTVCARPPKRLRALSSATGNGLK
jgi:hypothetical protein